ncbi:hypothetical protein OOT00_02465 [Desulfobotulus sp. H1]|uniref:Uncharacterized protein n=1 Tax=Desulfobotulus pelophilus TaxID=2823377 RepID=A0ABT3N5V6_9BACT|nr:hypothetical protein [Desulfobotulus pelophilus]MCW7752842.1 hypothetical protein [Desulfobotulus pelophilus]
MASFFSRLGPWGWAFWILVCCFLFTQYSTAQFVLGFLDAFDGAEEQHVFWVSQSMPWFFLKNILLSLGLPAVSLLAFLVFGKMKSEEGAYLSLPRVCSMEKVFDQCVYRQRREKRPFSLLFCRWHMDERGLMGFYGRRKKVMLAELLQVTEKEVRLTDYLVPVSRESFVILVDGGAEEGQVLSSRIDRKIALVFAPEMEGSDFRLCWGLAPYRPGDSLYELMERASRSLEKESGAGNMGVGDGAP